MMFKVLEEFNLFHYNAKNQSHRLTKYYKGDIIKESIRNRLTNKSLVEPYYEP